MLLNKAQVKKYNFLGFTLIEIIITLAITSILSLLLIPSISSALYRYELTSTANQLETLLHYARAEAIIRNDKVILCPVSESAECTQNWDSSLVVVKTGKGRLLRKVQLREHAIIDWRGFYRRNKIIFFPRIAQASSNGVLKISHEQCQFCQATITINRAGRVRKSIKRGTGSFLT